MRASPIALSVKNCTPEMIVPIKEITKAAIIFHFFNLYL